MLRLHLTKLNGNSYFDCRRLTKSFRLLEKTEYVAVIGNRHSVRLPVPLVLSI